MQVGASQSKVSGTALPPMALCWELTSKWSACGWSVVQHRSRRGDGDDAWDVMRHWSGEVQRTINSAELTSFLCYLRKALGPTMVHVDNKGLVDGLWRGEMRCIGPKAKDADLWVLIWEEVHRDHREGILVAGRAR